MERQGGDDDEIADWLAAESELRQPRDAAAELKEKSAMRMTERPFEIVTGASSGIGYELAKPCAEHEYDLLIAADEKEIHEATLALRDLGVAVEGVEVDLATTAGVDALHAATRGRPVDALLANAGHGLGHGFLDQDFEAIRHVIDTNVTGTVYLIHTVGRAMRARGQGRILITGRSRGSCRARTRSTSRPRVPLTPSRGRCARAQGHGRDRDCLMPGATETEFFARAEMLDTKGGQQPKDDPADVARVGLDAMLRGDGDVVSGWKNKLQAAVASVTPASILAEQHRKLAAPGSGHKRGVDST